MSDCNYVILCKTILVSFKCLCSDENDKNEKNRNNVPTTSKYIYINAFCI